jgi:hypothetical protein
MAKPKLVKQIPRAPTIDYFVHVTANPVTVVEIQRYPQYSDRALGNLFKTEDFEDIPSTSVEGNFQALS